MTNALLQFTSLILKAGKDFSPKNAVVEYEKNCKRCGHEWISRTSARPGRCPNCGSAVWDKPRTGKEPGARPKRNV